MSKINRQKSHRKADSLGKKKAAANLSAAADLSEEDSFTKL